MGDQLTPQLAFRHAELTAASGNAKAADALLASLAKRFGETNAIATARANLALRSGDLELAGEHFERASSLANDPVQRQRLGHLYRQLGDGEKERALLKAVDFADLTGFERLRLVDIVAAQGAMSEARALAETAVQMGGTDAKKQAERYAALALSADDPDDFVKTMAGWLDGPNAEALALPIATIIATIPQQSRAIASQMVASAPETRPLLVSTLSRVELFGAARMLAQPWSISGPPDRESWDALVFYADRSADVGLLEATLRHSDVPDDLKLQYLLPLVRYGGGQALLPYRHWLSDDRLESVPLVDAAWAIWKQFPDAAFDALRQAATPETDPVLWRAIASELGGTGYLERLHALSQSDTDIAAMFRR
ncbi:tetratricopeptide repeat protein [Marivita sp. S0852]|uniref:tetratricopeptide repeat protein n=1 Tax=Marivita sp. S0852 TaxID=3373893 RepID=UPI0039825C5A